MLVARTISPPAEEGIHDPGREDRATPPAAALAPVPRRLEVYRMNPSMGDVYTGSSRAKASFACALGVPKTTTFRVFLTCPNSLRNSALTCLAWATRASEF